MKKEILKYLCILLVISAFIFTKNSPRVTYAEMATQSAKEKKIEYDLAYPGILPDNFLYKLKVLRDKITALLISDPKKKVEYYLLQTDKGILASAMLVDKNKIELAQETALKAEHNYTLLTDELWKISERPDASFFKELTDSSLKHQEVLISLVKRVPENKQKTFNQVIEFSKRNLKSVEAYQKKRQEYEYELQ